MGSSTYKLTIIDRHHYKEKLTVNFIFKLTGYLIENLLIKNLSNFVRKNVKKNNWCIDMQ